MRNMPVDLSEFRKEQLQDAENALQGDGGTVIMSIVQRAMQVPVNKLMGTEEDGERNRGQIDIYKSILQMPTVLREERVNRVEEKSKD